jgi:hypothetical protein
MLCVGAKCKLMHIIYHDDMAAAVVAVQPSLPCFCEDVRQDRVATQSAYVVLSKVVAACRALSAWAAAYHEMLSWVLEEVLLEDTSTLHDNAYKLEQAIANSVEQMLSSCVACALVLVAVRADACLLATAVIS